MSGSLLLFLILLLIFLLPLLFLDVMFLALSKLGIPPVLAPFIIFGMLLGSVINIPIKRESILVPLPFHPLDIWGLNRSWPNLKKELREKILAINVGGFVIPIMLVCYEIVLIAWQRPDILLALGAAVFINILICYILAEPVPRVGITLPALVPGILAAATALIMAPDMAPPVAFCAGVLGPVIGADLMNLREIERAQVGIISIGGAGTFDGIVISGLIAVLLS